MREKPGISYLGQDLVTDGDKRNRWGAEIPESRKLGLRPGSTGDLYPLLPQSTPHKLPFLRPQKGVSSWDK